MTVLPIYRIVGCLSSKVALHDIDDVDAYVAGAVRKVIWLAVPASEREELELEGVAILYDLERRWNGRDSFRGYASSRLGFRLIDAFRRLYRGSRQGVLPPVSLDWQRERPGFDEGGVTLMRDFARAPAV